jgi:hypothetical protein
MRCAEQHLPPRELAELVVRCAQEGWQQIPTKINVEKNSSMHVSKTQSFNF